MHLIAIAFALLQYGGGDQQGNPGAIDLPDVVKKEQAPEPPPKPTQPPEPEPEATPEPERKTEPVQ
jgi:hypothetical protein